MDKSDPWYMSVPPKGEQRRYNRALTLSRWQRELPRLRAERKEAQAQGDREKYDRLGELIAYREGCINSWEAYLDGQHDTWTGRKLAE